MSDKNYKLRAMKKWLSYHLYTVITFTIGSLVTLIIILAIIILIVNKINGYS